MNATHRTRERVVLVAAALLVFAPSFAPAATGTSTTPPAAPTTPPKTATAAPAPPRTAPASYTPSTMPVPAKKLAPQVPPAAPTAKPTTTAAPTAKPTAPGAAAAPTAKTGATPVVRKSARPASPAARSDSTMKLKGSEEGTVFKTLTVEGEDRVHVDFDRPELELNVDPQQAPGLDLGSAADVLDRTTPDYVSPLMSAAANDPSPYLAHPWLGSFAAGSVARFRPAVEHLERWKLVVANSRGEVVANYAGNGDPPAELAWDGRTLNGGQAAPGLTYSYVFEAYDRAGNKRNFVGQGFKVPAYRVDTPSGPVLVFPGNELAGRFGRGAMMRPQAPAPILLEAAGYINAAGKPKQPLRVTATARSYDEANAMAALVARDLGALTLGDPARIRPVATVEVDAPEGGTVKISSEP